ncbi:MAG: hypothetical protein FJZ92_14705, partial [Chloroflexi bacterium]|nr:hypothetical protein [Chloroflexota bacterium]
MHEDDEAPAGQLRSPVLDDGQPRFPWWLPLPGVLVAAAWAAYAGAAGDGGAAGAGRALLWPGPAIAVG